MRSLDTNARRSSTRIDFRPSAQLAKCHKTTTESSLRKFQKFSGKLVAFKIYLGFLGLCVPLLSCHAGSQSSLDFPTSHGQSYDWRFDSKVRKDEDELDHTAVDTSILGKMGDDTERANSVDRYENLGTSAAIL
jgi:hypothetical protein